MSLYQETSMSRAIHSCPECGCILTKARSSADHRRFFGLLAKAFDAWPEAHEFQGSSVEHFRAYLLVQAGYTSVTTVDLSEITAANPHLLAAARIAIEEAVAAGLRNGDYVFTRPRGDVVEVLRARSINWATLSQKDFGPIREAVETIIEAAIGVSSEQLLKEQAA